MLDHPFSKSTCLNFAGSMLDGIDENRLKTGKPKVKVKYFRGARTNDIGAFYLKSGDLHLNDKALGRLAINLKLKIRKL